MIIGPRKRNDWGWMMLSVLWVLLIVMGASGDDFCQIAAPILPGSDGNPVVRMKSEVIGVTAFQSADTKNLNFTLGERVNKLKTQKVSTLEESKKTNNEEWLTSTEGLYYTGFNFVRVGDYGKALPYFERAAQKDPTFGPAFYRIGYCHSKLGRYMEAIDAFKRIIYIQPDSAEAAEAQNALGWVYDKLGRDSEAIAAYKQATLINPDFAMAHCNLGRGYLKQGRYMEAIGAYKKAIQIKPDYAEAHYDLGFIYDKLKRHIEEIDAYKQAIRIEPDFADAHFNLGITYAALGRYREAIDAFKETIRIKPNDAEAHYNLGMTYWIIGDKGSALDQYEVLKNLHKELATRLFNLIL